jgi:hypothetical protein
MSSFHTKKVKEHAATRAHHHRIPHVAHPLSPLRNNKTIPQHHENTNAYKSGHSNRRQKAQHTLRWLARRPHEHACRRARSYEFHATNSSNPTKSDARICLLPSPVALGSAALSHPTYGGFVLQVQSLPVSSTLALPSRVESPWALLSFSHALARRQNTNASRGPWQESVWMHWVVLSR